jgi:hypothetical protein
LQRHDINAVREAFAESRAFEESKIASFESFAEFVGRYEFVEFLSDALVVWVAGADKCELFECELGRVGVFLEQPSLITVSYVLVRIED